MKTLLAPLATRSGRTWHYVSLAEAERQGLCAVSALPYVLRVVLENVLRQRVFGGGSAHDVDALASWPACAGDGAYVQFRPARVMMDDTAGLPLLGELAAMRAAAKRFGATARAIDLAIPVDFIVDHSIAADYTARADALKLNMALEIGRNAERYRFLRWASRAFRNLRVVPPGRGICHQINLEHLSLVVRTDDERAVASPDTMVGIDSHTPMVNAVGVAAWGVSGIEGLSAALGEPVALQLSPVIGCRLTGRLAPGVTATDLVLTMTHELRAYGVVGKLVEYSGPGLASLALEDRATVANMTPEAGATMSYFPIDAETLRYLEATGRTREHVELVEAYAKAQHLWYEDQSACPRYSAIIDIDLACIEPSISGPRLPHGHLSLREAPTLFEATPRQNSAITDGDVVIAAITSCTNTSNPSLMIAAGLLARNAVRRGLRTQPCVRTSLSPGSRAVADYLRVSGLQESLDALGFHVSGFGCMSCVGFSGALDADIAAAIENGARAVAVLSGNRNYEGRVHPLVRETFLASPPLVIAYALAGNMRTNLTTDPLGRDSAGRPVYLRDLWPDAREIEDVMDAVLDPRLFASAYADVFTGTAAWDALEAQNGEEFEWQRDSTFIRPPPHYCDMNIEPECTSAIRGARILAMYGDMVTTEHISPMGSIPSGSPAARYLESLGVQPAQFGSYAARRLNHDVMVRGTFASPYLVNELVRAQAGGCTMFAPDRSVMTIFDAAERYRLDAIPLVIIAGQSFGAGSSRDWSARGPRALGVRAVIAESYERIYRANLVVAGVLPLEFVGANRRSLGLDGTETVDIDCATDRDTVQAVFTRGPGDSIETILNIRVETAAEMESLRHGGLLRRLLRERLPH